MSNNYHFYDESHLGIIDYYHSPELQLSWGGPFNNQKFRQEMFLELLKIIDFTAIVETGTYRGTTTDFMAQTSHLPVYTVESHPRYYAYSQRRFLHNPNINSYYSDSRVFLRRLSRHLGQEQILFYLDAHWNDELPLKKELEIIFKNWHNALVLIDDFQVPDDEGYFYDDYGEGKALILEYLNCLEYLHLEKFFPAVNSDTETGGKRGCIVLAQAPEIIEKLKIAETLRSYLVQSNT